MIPFLLAMDIDGLAPKGQATTAATSALIAQAAPSPDSPITSNSFPYASLQLGVGFPNNLDGTFKLGDDTFDTSLELDPGFNGELALGYQFNQARAEIAVGYGSYGVDQQTFDGGTIRIPGRDSVDVTTVMLNGYYDFPIRNKNGEKSRWSPYIGAGIGYANISKPACPREGCFAGGSTNGFAYQGKVGISYRLADRSFAFLEGGYLGSTAGSVDGIDFDNFGSWRINVGFRIGFGGAAQTKPVPQVQDVQDVQPEPEVSPQPQVITPEPTPTVTPQKSMPIRGLW